MMKFVTAALLLAAQPVLATPVAAVRVPIADLDLTTSAGVRLLDQRLERAARRVCGAPGLGMPLATSWAVQDCRRDALARARPARDAAIARASLRFERLAAR
ncbi:UrcA family protein [Thermaurantiacus sp.]